MFSAEDLVFIEERGSDLNTVKEQVKNFENGFPFVEIIQAATLGKGIIQLDELHVDEFIHFFEHQLAKGISLLKFVPASGAASRMFKSLYSAIDQLEKGTPEAEVLQDQEVKSFFDRLKDFAFYNDLKKSAGNPLDQLSKLEILKLVLTESGLNYGNLPKGLLQFHQYQEKSRTPFQEHAVEGALYAKDKNGKVKIHFTVSPEHQEAFQSHLKEIQEVYDQFIAEYLFIIVRIAINCFQSCQ